MDEDTREQKGSNSSMKPIAISIVVAALLIAGAILYTRANPPENQVAGVGGTQPTKTKIRPVTDDDFLRGSPGAEIVLVEYSDFECPYCAQFHQTMKRLMDEYGKDGRLAWVYRQFPIEQLHRKAWTESIASECVALQGGDEAFWKFADEAFATGTGNDTLDLATLPDIAARAGATDRAAFMECVENESTRPAVQADYDDAIASGGKGTPHNVIIARGQSVPISGAQPYATMRAIIETILAPEGTSAQPAVGQ